MTKACRQGVAEACRKGRGEGGRESACETSLLLSAERYGSVLNSAFTKSRNLRCCRQFPNPIQAGLG
jgi:hypothetical protein